MYALSRHALRVWDCARFVLTLTVIGLHDAADALQDAIDPRRLRTGNG